MSMDLVPSNQNIPGFWGRKEGKWGMGAIALMVGGGILGLHAFGGALLGALTTGVAILGQAWMMAILGTGLFAFLWILFGTNLPKLVGFWFKAATRRVAGVFVAVYPVEIIYEFVSKMRKKALEFAESKKKIKSQERILKDTKQQVEEEKEIALRTMRAAEKQGNQMEKTLQARIAGQHEETLKRFIEPSLEQIGVLYQRLERVEKVIDFKIRDMESQARNLKRQTEISKATKSALKAGWDILRGSDPEQELYDMAVEYVVEDYRATMGMVDDFMSSTESILNGVDLKNGMWEEKALEMLAELDHKEQLLISKAPNAQIIVPSTIDAQVLSVLPASSSSISTKYFQ